MDEPPRRGDDAMPDASDFRLTLIKRKVSAFTHVDFAKLPPACAPMIVRAEF